MKKSISIVALFLFSLVLVSSASYDLPGNLERGMDGAIRIIESLFTPLVYVFFGGYGELMFERVLLLLIIISIVYVVVSKMDIFKDNGGVIWIITLSVSLLALRFMTDELIENIILPYSIMGVALSAALPLIIYFTFVQSFESSSTIRKILWIFFIVVFIGLWDSRYDSLGSLSWIYFATGLLGFIFLFFDGTIRRYILRQQFGELDRDRRFQTISKLSTDLEKLEDSYSRNHIPEANYKRMKKKLLKQIENLRKH